MVLFRAIARRDVITAGEIADRQVRSFARSGARRRMRDCAKPRAGRRPAIHDIKLNRGSRKPRRKGAIEGSAPCWS